LRGCGKSELTGLLVKAIPVTNGKNNYYIGLLIKKKILLQGFCRILQEYFEECDVEGG